MQYDSFNDLSNALISQYWSDFKNGHAWNYYLASARYVQGDTWAGKEDFVSIAQDCLKKNLNVLQSLEVLLREEKDGVLEIAENVVNDWFENNGHDAYYYFDIMVHLPEDNPCRSHYFGVDKIKSFLSYCDGSGWNEMARTALFSVEDKTLCLAAADLITSFFKADSLSEDSAENVALPLLAEMGHLASRYISLDIIDKAKTFCRQYLAKDEQYIVDLTNNLINLDDVYAERSVWLRDEIAHICWCLGWSDILDEVWRSEWYRLSLFEEVYSDQYNNELLVWSLLHDCESLRNRAISVMQNHQYRKIDGAIAWQRLNR